MARTPSNMVSLGTKAPDFSLYDVISEEQKNLSELKGKNGSVIMFICNHCPYVKHVNKTIVNLANKFKNNDIILLRFLVMMLLIILKTVLN